MSSMGLWFDQIKFLQQIPGASVSPDMTSRYIARWAPTSLLLILTAAATAQEAIATDSSESRWMGPDGRPLPFETAEEVLDFLRTAKIVSQKELTGGINRPLKVRLRQDGVEANAIFRIVDIRHKRAKLDGKIVPDFHDSYAYECAAWDVSQLLGIDNVPPCTRRRYELVDGTMQLWVEGTMTEEKRRATDTDPPEQLQWMRQKQTMRLFDALIYNFDRNQGNMLIDEAWKLWFIDHTRSFRKSAAIENLDKIVWCEREIFERLKKLDKKTLSRRLRNLVTGVQMGFMLKRRDKLVDHLSSLVDEKRVTAVFWDASDPDVGSAELLEVVADDDIPVTSSRLEDSHAPRAKPPV